MYDKHIGNSNYYRILKTVSSKVNGRNYKISIKELAEYIQGEYDFGYLSSTQYDDLMHMIGGYHYGTSKGATTFKVASEKSTFDVNDKTATYALNRLVFHNIYGKGKVVELNRRYAYIQFACGKEAKFIPEKFNLHLKAV